MLEEPLLYSQTLSIDTEIGLTAWILAVRNGVGHIWRCSNTMNRVIMKMLVTTY